MKKATKADIHYIQTNPEELGVAELAKETGLTNTQVKNILGKVEKEAASPAKGAGQFDKLLGKHKSRKGVVVMTEGASQLADESRVANKPRDTSSFITKARP